MSPTRFLKAFVDDQMLSMRVVCGLVCLLQHILFHGALGEKAFFFQRENKPTNESYATHFITPPLGGPTEVTSFSLSVWFNVQKFREATYAFSYATSDDMDNLLNFRVRANSIRIYFAGSTSKVEYRTVNIIPKKWYHLGVTVNESAEVFEIYLDGELTNVGRITPTAMSLNGSLVLGQETDNLNGGFVTQQSFSGRLSEFNLYGRVLTFEEIQAISECDDTLQPGEGDILSWSSASWELHGSVEEENVTLCPRKQDPYKLMVEQLNFYNAESLCQALFKSHLYVPPNEYWNDQLYNDAAPFIHKCKPQNHGQSYFWLGATDKYKNDTWRDMKGDRLNFTNFRTPLDFNQKCAAFDLLPHFGAWNDVFCKHLTFCFSCTNTWSVSLRIRGLCEKYQEGRLFRLGDDSHDGRRNIEGFSRYRIIFNESTFTWFLFDEWKDQLMATLVDFKGSYPIGTRKWNIKADHVVCGLLKEQKRLLTLSTCNSSEFTCFDGSCVPLSKRCDLVANCRDNSDENECQKLRRSSDYMKILPPPGSNGGRLHVNLSVVVDKISEVDVLNMKIRIDLIIEMTWYDPRLTFANLNKMKAINIINVDEVWVPVAEYISADFPSIHEMTPSLTVHRESAPMKDDTSRHLRDEHYDGRSNPLVLNQRINSHFDCLMDLSLYPFDLQKCHIELQQRSGSDDLVTWGNLRVSYIGERELSEYQIGPTTATIGRKGEHSLGVVTITLYRRYAYYITTIYVPTSMMVIICYASLFCKPEDKDLRIMMTITTLLVLYSLYQQISNTLPKTSYTKAVDVWCFFSLLVICSLVFFHVMSGVTRMCSPCQGSTSFKVQDTTTTFGNINTGCNCTVQKSFRTSRVVYLLVIFAFTLGYFFVIQYYLSLN